MNLPARFIVWRTRCLWLGISIFILQIASMFISLSWSHASSRFTLGLGAGMIQMRQGFNSVWAGPWPSGIQIHTDFNVALWPRQYGWAGMGPQPRISECPLWVPALIVMLPVLLTRREHRSDLCPQCDYDLTGDTSGRCPECGSAVPGGSLLIHKADKAA